MAPGQHLPSPDFAKDAWGSGGVYTTAYGAPVAHPYEVQRASGNGPLLLQDIHLVELLSHFDRERIPERVVHAKGGGAHGTFKLTHPIPELTCAKVFSKPGTECSVTVRFSTVGGERGSPDAARDPRGFSIKMRTEEGNLDWVFNNTPIFFLRDPAKFPNFIHTQKRLPQSNATHGDDSTQFWEYMSQNPESVHQFIYLFGPRGIPQSWRHMQGYSGHTMKFVNSQGEWHYCQIHVISKQGVKNMHPDDAAKASPDVHQLDLFDAIERGEYPKWDFMYQLASKAEADAAGLDVFDLTRTWDRKKFPLKPLGELELNQNVANYFAEIEQVAFAPSTLVSGIEPSADPVLQSRLFSYHDTHRHRVGVNYQQLPVNRPNVPYPMYTMQRDGAMAFENQGARPLHLSSIDPPTLRPRPYDISKTAGYDDGHAISFLSGVSLQDFEQPRALWQRVFTEEDRQLSVKEISGHMSNSRDKQSITQAVNIFWLVDQQLGDALAQNLKLDAGSWKKELRDLQFIGSHNFESNKDALSMLESYKSTQQKAAEMAGDFTTAVKEGASFVAQKAQQAYNGVQTNGNGVHANGDGVH
jgi:catalase